ncbi:cobalamin trafficking protein CblD-like [Symsagittifera roscoffensis]|uniref:cobalamin trafficking protein CblD-like n=1 Tax=Symsagittifera roscoffensis TaxID=84072 RepID=UPI00307C05F9
MSVFAKKYRLFCHTFRNYPGILFIFNRDLSSSSGDGPGTFWGAQSYLTSSSANSKQKKGSTGETQSSDSLIPKEQDGAKDESNTGANISNSTQYSTSNPIIPDSTFPLPGNVGFSETFFNEFFQGTQSTEYSKAPSKSEVFIGSSGYSKDEIKNDLFAFSGMQLPNDEHKIETLQKFVKVLRADNSFGETASPVFPNFENLKEVIFSYHIPIEVCTFKCPQFIKNEILRLFPMNSDLKSRNLVLINLSHKTVNDMSGWNDSVDEEREQVIEKFVHGAQLICEFLKVQNYFADFIDPMTGKPFYAPHTNSTLFETDELYEKFGFRIDDLGCCKVVHHGTFGTHVFVGTILTDAPVSDKFLSQTETTT